MSTKRGITRRGFLRAAAAAPLVPLVAGLGGCGSKPAEKGRVIVVGGGLCGLVTLDRLVKAGREAILLEAGSRLGGRIYTVRDEKVVPWAKGFSRGLRAEMGAERVGAGDLGLRDLLTELGIGTAAYPPPTQRLELRWKDRSYRFKEAPDLPQELFEGLSEIERSGAPLGIVGALIERAKAPASDDARSAIAWLREIGMTPRGEEFVRAFEALPLDTMPAPVFHRVVIRDQKAGRSDTVAGGTDRIITKLAERHASAITKAVAIASVRQGEQGVVLADAQGRTFEGATAIFCLPLTPLRSLGFAAGVPDALAVRLRGLDVAHEMKVANESSDRSLPDYVFRERWVSWRLPETSAAGSFIEQGLRWQPNEARPPDEWDPLTTMGPGPLSHSFATDPLIGGAYAYSKSGTAPEGIVRAGRLIFAGADLSDAPGWMEGAVRAAEQAVAAVGGVTYFAAARFF